MEFRKGNRPGPRRTWRVWLLGNPPSQDALTSQTESRASPSTASSSQPPPPHNSPTPPPATRRRPSLDSTTLPAWSDMSDSSSSSDSEDFSTLSDDDESSASTESDDCSPSPPDSDEERGRSRRCRRNRAREPLHGRTSLSHEACTTGIPGTRRRGQRDCCHDGMHAAHHCHSRCCVRHCRAQLTCGCYYCCSLRRIKIDRQGRERTEYKRRDEEKMAWGAKPEHGAVAERGLLRTVVAWTRWAVVVGFQTVACVPGV